MGTPSRSAQQSAQQVVEEPQLIFAHAVEGLFGHALRGRVSPALQERLRAHGLDLDRPLLPAYGSPVWHRCLAEVVRELWSDTPEPEGYRQLGRAVVFGFRNTLLGRPMEALARVVGVRRLLERMEKNVRTGDNHTRIRVERLGEQHLQMDVSHVTDFPSYYQGIIEAAAELAGGREVQVRLLAHQAPAARYDVRWR